MKEKKPDTSFLWFYYGLECLDQNRTISGLLQDVLRRLGREPPEIILSSCLVGWAWVIQSFTVKIFEKICTKNK